MNQLELHQKDRSIRKFLPKAIPEEDLDYIMDNVRYAHCANNLQRLRFVLVTGIEKRKEVGDLLHYAALLPAEVGQPKEEERPAAYIVITVPDQTAPMTDFDAGIAAEVITSSAAERDIASCILFNFNKEEMKKTLGIAEGRMPRLVISLGYAAITSSIEAVKDGSLKYYTDEDGNYHVPKCDVTDLFERK